MFPFLKNKKKRPSSHNANQETRDFLTSFEQLGNSQQLNQSCKDLVKKVPLEQINQHDKNALNDNRELILQKAGPNAWNRIAENFNLEPVCSDQMTNLSCAVNNLMKDFIVLQGSNWAFDFTDAKEQLILLVEALEKLPNVNKADKEAGEAIKEAFITLNCHDLAVRMCQKLEIDAPTRPTVVPYRR